MKKNLHKPRWLSVCPIRMRKVPKPDWPNLPILLLIFTLLLSVYLLTFSGVGVTDDEQLFTVLTGSLASGRGYSALALLGNDRLRGDAGSIEPLHPMLGVPLYLLAKRAGWGGAQALHLLPGIYSALSAALLAAIALRRGYGRKTAIIFSLAFGLGTLALPYARTNFREPLAMLCLAGAGFYLDSLCEKGRLSWQQTLTLLGVISLGGLAALTKVTCTLCLPFLLIAAVLNLKHQAGRSLFSILGMLAVCLLIGAGIFLSLNTLLPGFALSRYSLDFLDYMLRTLPRLPHENFLSAIAGMLVSPGKGLLVYSPVLLLAFFSFKKIRKNISDWVAGLGSLAALMVMQALVYDQDWWGITWSTRALLPALPLLMLVCLPALDAGLRHQRKIVRNLTWLLLGLSLLIQSGRLLVPDPAYVGWLVQTTGQNVSASVQWDLRLMPLWRHWQLAFQGIPSDIAWLQLDLPGGYSAIALVAAITTLGSLCTWLLFKGDAPHSAHAFILLGLALALLPVVLSAACYDRRYYGGNENYRSASETVCEIAARDDIVLVDTYIKPLWWYTFNFGCTQVEWLGLPYEHTKPFSGDLYYPRLGELGLLLQEKQAQGRGLYLLETVPPDPLAYHEELEKHGFNTFLLQEFADGKMAGVRLYRVE